MPTITPICGELNSHRLIMDRLKKALLAKDFELTVVFPTLSLLHKIQDELLDQPDVAGVGGIRLLLFEGFIKEIGQKFGLQQQTPSALTKELLIAEVFETLKAQGKLAYLSKAPFTAGYRQAILAGIAEWKRSCFSPELFSKWAAGQGEKEKQLALIYRAYQELLVQKGYLEEDLLLLHLNELRPPSGGPAAAVPVILYGFSDLTPLQKQFIKALEPWCDFEILLDPTPVAEIRNFITGRFRLGGLPEAPRLTFNNALGRLQSCFWRDEPQPSALPADDDSLQILQAAGGNKQAVGIAREIVQLLRQNPGYDPDDFLILCPRPQIFLKAALPVFAEYQLPLPEEDAPLREYPEVKRFSQAVTVCGADWPWPEMEIFIRQCYIRESAAEGDRVLLELGENYAALSGRERWLNLFKNDGFRQYFSEKGLNLLPLQKGIGLLESIPGEAGLRDYLDLARNWMVAALTADLQYSISKRSNRQETLENLRALQYLIAVLEEITGYLKTARSFSNELNLQEFQSFWNNYLLTLEVKPVPTRESVIKVLVPREARGLKAKVVFITGLEQGVFPRNYINDWKLSIKDRRALQVRGVELETGEEYQTQERLAFYWALQTAAERLYLVYQEQDSSGQPLNHSPYLDEVRQWFPDLIGRIKSYPLAPEPPSDFRECYSAFERRIYLASYFTAPAAAISSAEGDIGLRMLRNPIYQQLALQIWQECSWREASEPGFFRNPASAKLLDKIFGTDHTFAITALEDYHSCPYRFFLKQLLKVKPLIKPQLLPDNLGLGNLYHQVLQEFGEFYRGQGLSAQQVQEYRRTLNECFNDFYREWRDSAANDLVKLVLALQEEQIRSTLNKWLNSELIWAEESGGRFKINFLEFGFGLIRGDFDSASLAHPYQFDDEGRTIKIWGKADRIDTDADGNFIVYDYKLGLGPTVKNLLQIDYLQIPLYLLALEELHFGAGKAVGGSYLGLKEPSRSRGGVWRRDKLRAAMTGKGVLEEPEWEEWLVSVKTTLSGIVRAIRNGDFYPAAKECLPFCEYKGCCRRDRREVEQSDEISAESATS